MFECVGDVVSGASGARVPGNVGGSEDEGTSGKHQAAAQHIRST